MTGISAAGKTTLCNALYELLKPSHQNLVLLDSEVIRSAMGGDLGYSEAERKIQIQRIQGLTQALTRQDLIVLVAVLYSHPDLLAWNRENIPGYFEVYINAPLTLARARDPKGLYAKAAEGDLPDVVGIDIPWHVPERPDLTIDATIEEDPALLARRVTASVPWLAAGA
ncbi:MAG: adenylyl-sulfate kinase [Alphaproteobacteria bacterium]|nr:adenylyl-sulfate kinase [Alphaproteobacteria bacterium]